MWTNVCLAENSHGTANIMSVHTPLEQKLTQDISGLVFVTKLS